MTFRPLFSRDRLWASLAALALFAFAILAALAMVKRPLGPGTVLLGGLMALLLGTAALLLYRLWALHGLEYWVQRDAVHIHWQGEEAIIPLPEIQAVRPAAVTLRSAWHRWPAQWVQVDAETHVFSYATQAPENCRRLSPMKKSISSRPSILMILWRLTRIDAPSGLPAG
jgi:hypothetical protein